MFYLVVALAVPCACSALSGYVLMAIISLKLLPIGFVTPVMNSADPGASNDPPLW